MKQPPKTEKKNIKVDLTYPLLGATILGCIIGGPVGISIAVGSLGILGAAVAVEVKKQGIVFRPSKADAQKFPATAPEPLTAGEVTLARNIFGDRIDLDGVTKSFAEGIKQKGDDLTIAQVFGRKSIKFYGTVPAQDFSKESATNEYNIGLLMHELTHIWQGQRRLRHIFNRFMRNRSYTYRLTEHSRFADFGTEQQATLVEDYTKQLMHGTVWRLLGADIYLPSFAMAKTVEEAGAESQKASWLIAVVEAQFPAAKKTRLAMEAKVAAKPEIKELLAKLKSPATEAKSTPRPPQF